MSVTTTVQYYIDEDDQHFEDSQTYLTAESHTCRGACTSNWYGYKTEKTSAGANLTSDKVSKTDKPMVDSPDDRILPAEELDQPRRVSIHESEANKKVVQPLYAAQKPATPATQPRSQMFSSFGGVSATLHMIRDPIADYQETRGLSRNEQISFVNLVTSLCTQAYTAAITILVMLWNLLPLLEGFLFFIRFLLDKLIDIFDTQDTTDKAIKAAVLLGELIVIFIILFLIIGLILIPVYQLATRLLGKVWGMIV